ncbi:hypothetical protein BYT27DRAFT_7201393 [Phlegmacium glaucopus]|nr:hypothetical protein BYT27DRAFT_7201393 [Phlegmacium glaucopus]
MRLHAWQGISSVPTLPIFSLLFLRTGYRRNQFSDEKHVETEKQLYEDLGPHPNSRPTSKD